LITAAMAIGGFARFHAVTKSIQDSSKTFV
jgi:hypothetical protein